MDGELIVAGQTSDGIDTSERSLIQERDKCQNSWLKYPSNTLEFPVYLLNPSTNVAQLFGRVFIIEHFIF